MKIKFLKGKKIKIEKLSRKDLENTREFKNFINSLVKEKAQILINKKFSLKEEKNWLKEQLKKNNKHKTVILIAKSNNIIVGTTEISLGGWRQDHIGELGISIKKDYRGMGLGKYLMTETIKLAKKELKLKFIKLSVFSTNKPAIEFYKKYGFKTVAIIPKQIKYGGKLVDEIIMLK